MIHTLVVLGLLVIGQSLTWRKYNDDGTATSLYRWLCKRVIGATLTLAAYVLIWTETTDRYLLTITSMGGMIAAILLVHWVRAYIVVDRILRTPRREGVHS